MRYAANTFTKYIPFKSFFCRRQQRGGEDPEVGAAHPVPQQHVPQLPPDDQDEGGRVGVHHQYPPPPPPQLFRGNDIFMSDQEEEEEQEEAHNQLPPPSWRHMEVQTDTIAPPLPMSGTGHPGYRNLKDEICDIFPHADVATTSSTQPNNSSSTSGFCDGDEYSSEDDEYVNNEEEDEDYEPSDSYYLQESVTHTSRFGRTVQVPPGMASVR